MERIIGNRYPITDALFKATGETRYTGDIQLQGLCHGKLILSSIPFGKVVEIQVNEALKVPGVIDIYTAKDFPDVKYNSALRFKDHGILKTETILTDVVRFVGDRIGLILAENIAAAEEALRQIKVRYEEYAPVFDEEEAVLDSNSRLHEICPNRVGTINVGKTDAEIDELMKSADRIFEDRYKIPMVGQTPMETHTVLAEWREQKLTIWATTQNAFAIRVLASDVLGLPYHRIRVIQPTLGGSFGSKLEAVTELVAAAASMKSGRPVRIALSRKENMIASRTRNGATVRIRTGVKEDGTIVASDFNILTNTGAYVGSAMNVVGAMSHKLFKVYRFPLKFSGSPVLTNTPIAGAMRGYGSPQAFLGMQLHLDGIARALGMDPGELLKKNIWKNTDVDPVVFGNPELMACIDRGMDLFSWKERKAATASWNRSNHRTIRGVGIGLGSHGSGVFGAHQDLINLLLRLNEDGTFNYWSASHDMGNGSLTAQKMIIAEVLGIQVEAIEATEVNTETCPWNLGDYASRGIFVEGEGARKAAMAMRDLLLATAAQQSEENQGNLDLQDGLILKKGQPLFTLSELAMYAQTTLQKELLVSVDHHSTAGRSSYGAHFAEVEVDKESGRVKVLYFVGVHDVGKVINRMGVEGQLEGGIHMGLGYALTERMSFDVAGNLIENSLKKYHLLRADEMPEMKVDFIENGDTGGPFGAKSISECAVVPVAPAVLNAVSDALGQQIYDIPVNPVEILKILGKGEPS